ncbi:1758ad38-e98f-45ee-ab4e-753767fab624 [Thermothielavioides terrestris]|uniref:1758ad38-e98f-45ee-ab4e-753767fab624 n=1 Tax=Thermothielavioides terrestris TaxID=2587410 RepID=A0A446BJS0_9PEZI|nr:1758ad38-e98f-45ee-ab4e-753767fab624 [Thermothielavioides terrestris]
MKCHARIRGLLQCPAAPAGADKHAQNISPIDLARLIHFYSHNLRGQLALVAEKAQHNAKLKGTEAAQRSLIHAGMAEDR